MVAAQIVYSTLGVIGTDVIVSVVQSGSIVTFNIKSTLFEK